MTKRHLLFLLSFLTAILPALSESNDSRPETKNGYEKSDTQIAPLIREDRVWEYVDKENYRIIRMKFDGTKEIDGKTYHILKSIYAQGSDMVKQDNEHVGRYTTPTPIAYMREENGKVWMRKDAASKNEFTFVGGFFSAGHAGNHNNTEGIIGSAEQDYLIYDFSAKEGDVVNTLELFENPESECKIYGHLMGVQKWAVDATIVPGDTYAIEEGQEEFFKQHGIEGNTYDINRVVTNYDMYDWCKGGDKEDLCHRENMKDWEFTVSEVTNLQMDLQDKMIDSPAYHGTLKHQKTCWYDAVEGVGCIEGGTLCFPGTHFWWYGCWGSTMYLNRVYDTDGNIVFENPIPSCKIIETNLDLSGIEEVNSEGYVLYREREIIANGNGEISIALFAANGTAVASRSGENEVTLSTAVLPAGIYIAVIKAGNKTETKKILVK